MILDSLLEIPRDFNPIVVGCSYFKSVKEIPEYFKYYIGGILFNNHCDTEYRRESKNFFKFSEKYIFVDYRLSEVISKKGNIWKLKDPGETDKNKFYFLVSDGNGKYAHGNTIKEAKADLIYKISIRDKSHFKNLDLNKKFEFSELIEMYRTITGACSIGVRNFVETLKLEKKPYSISEVFKLTENQYGGRVFREFFLS